MYSTKELLIKVERLQTILINHATGQSQQTDNDEYVKLRLELIGTPNLDLPALVYSCENLQSLRNSMPELQHYSERREHLRKEFENVLNRLRAEIYPSSKLSRREVHYEGDLFEKQFPAGLPFGIKKPALAFIPAQGSQKAIFEDELEVGVIRKGVYPNLTYQKLQNELKETPIGPKGLTLVRLLFMCQTQREKEFLAYYVREYDMLSKEVPFLVPQAWIQWHSKTKRDLRSEASSYSDDLYRVDFVAFWKNARFAILVDDIGHYAKQVGIRWDADEQKYAMRLKEDRKLRKEGWQVFRVSNWEIREEIFIAEILSDLREYIDF